MENSQWDWESLAFDFYRTDCNVRYAYSADKGCWSDLFVSEEEYIPVHVAASCLNYGTELFEGLKAFRGADGRIRIFRIEDTVRRLQSSARRLCLPVPTDEMIRTACTEVVRRNLRHLPPYGNDVALYIRPLEIGISAQVGVKPAKEYMFLILVSPVGPYFKEGFKPTNICITRRFDRVAPKGTGRRKVGGNYAASLEAGELAHSKGYSAVLYLDPKEKNYLDECRPANFFAIKNG